MKLCERKIYLITNTMVTIQQKNCDFLAYLIHFFEIGRSTEYQAPSIFNQDQKSLNVYLLIIFSGLFKNNFLKS